MYSKLEIDHTGEFGDQWDGTLYKDLPYSKLQRYFAQRVIEQVILPRETNNNKTLRALDIGCGDGYTTEKLSHALSCPTLGVDKSQSMIDAARQRQSSNPNLFFRKLDISDEKSGFSEQYSLIVSFFCLHWILKQEQVYANIAKALDEKGHGYLLVSTQKQVQTNKKSYITFVHELLTTEPYSTYFAKFAIERANLNKDNLPAYIKNAGLEVINMVEINEAYTYASQKELSQFFQGIISGYLVLKDGVIIDKDKLFELVGSLCDRLVEKLVAQNSYSKLDGGGLESQQSLLLAIIQKPAHIEPSLLMHALGVSSALESEHMETNSL